MAVNPTPYRPHPPRSSDMEYDAIVSVWNDGRVHRARITVVIDRQELAEHLANKAVRNKTLRTTSTFGSIRAKLEFKP